MRKCCALFSSPRCTCARARQGLWRSTGELLSVHGAAPLSTVATRGMTKNIKQVGQGGGGWMRMASLAARTMITFNYDGEASAADFGCSRWLQLTATHAPWACAKVSSPRAQAQQTIISGAKVTPRVRRTVARQKVALLVTKALAAACDKEP